MVVFFYGGSWNDSSTPGLPLCRSRHWPRAVSSQWWRITACIRRYAIRFLLDAAYAVAWTQHNIAGYGGDPQRIFLMGHSAGAYNAAMLALDSRQLAQVRLAPDSLRGWIGLAGPYDFLPVTNPRSRPVYCRIPGGFTADQPCQRCSTTSPVARLTR